LLETEIWSTWMDTSDPFIQSFKKL
jgi:hypothetical protein